jgi:hypothetical protein
MTIHPNLETLLRQLEEIKQEAQEIEDGIKNYSERSKALRGKITSVYGKIDAMLGTQQPEPAKNACNHPHWDDVSPNSNLIVKQCATCSEFKFTI